MARKKTTTAASTETNETASDAQATETAVETATSEAANATKEAANATNEAVQAETQAKTTDDAASYTVTWTKQAGKTVKVLKGALITFDAEGKAVVDAENARRLSKIRGVSVEGL